MKIDIIGAGIGGLTTGILLQQQGHQVDIYEAAPEINSVGAGIILANNAMQVYKTMGLANKLMKHGNSIGTMKITDPRLRPLSTISLKEFTEQYAVENLSIHRSVLQKLLLEEFGKSQVHLGKRLAHIEEGAPYKLNFEDGSVVESSLIIGADGIHSVVRKHFHDDVTIRDAGQMCWRGILDYVLPSPFQNEVIEAWGKGKRFGFVQVNNQSTYWYALLNATSAENVSPLSEVFSDFDPLIKNLIKHTSSAHIIENKIIDIKPFSIWSKGSVCLIGDAAHATTPNMGQGACQAIEDAYVLSQCLKKEPIISSAFKEFENLRIKKAHKVVSNSWKIGKMAQMENRFAIWLRNQLMKIMPESSGKQQLKKMFKVPEIEE